ncbi:hypothetical protein AGDE_11191 [Angomonas deanei]|uniref:Uncharacterized protein n=1 Tax=Angomonas deanei TaxID=59799 RepID=A0A7G2CCJ7_9TRYP|nr:hypothetical protein AGDE_11191 [Angomonas deanei]CAD2216741.1 hypothetical protein, conserved [Angomonas deanei]|eukprot:EPY26590.1 hypothetical protein AGDE_11191 [Angomonas deanei]
MLLRENTLLASEVSLGNTKKHIVELLREVDKLKQSVAIYENDLERLTRQNDHTKEQHRQVREQLNQLTSEHEIKVAGMEKEIQNLAVENKDMQLQLFRLRKQVSGGKAKILKDGYRQMKKTKMGMMTSLFSEGDERVGLLILHSQIESRLNEVLDTYDNEYVLTNEALRGDLKRKMGSTVIVLLEEIHLCEQSYRRLVPPKPAIESNNTSNNKEAEEEVDETDGFVAVMFNEKIYENMMSRQVIKDKMESAEKALSEEAKGFHIAQSEGEGQPRQRLMSLSSEPDFTAKNKLISNADTGKSSPTTPAAKTEQKKMLGELAAEKKKEWIKNIFGTDEKSKFLSVGSKDLVVSLFPKEHIPSDLLVDRLVRNPMRDISSKKFMAGVDVFAGRDPAQQRLLCSVNHIDPSEAIHLPENTNFVKVKYKSSIEDNKEQNGKKLAATLEMSKSEFGNSLNKKKMMENVQDWGGKTNFVEERTEEDAAAKELLNVKENLRIFKELAQIRSNEAKASNQKAGGVSSTTATTVAFQRLDPMSPNRAPEWTLYQNLFGAYRTLTPRMMEVTTIDHILLRACERHFTRLENRYEFCNQEANTRATNYQMCLTLAERYFREAYYLTDFQESIVDELEERYCYPELVAKTYYELLCYMDAMAPTDSLMSLYLSVIRGFFPPTYIHYICFMLFNLSYSWPTANPVEEVNRDDALTVLRYLYRNSDNVVHVNIHDIMKDFDMATRSSTVTFVAMRQFLANSILHLEESMILYFHGMFRNFCDVENLDEVPYEIYADVLAKQWQVKMEKKIYVRFLLTGLGFNKNPLLSVKDLVWVASSSWCSQLWM